MDYTVDDYIKAQDDCDKRDTCRGCPHFLKDLCTINSDTDLINALKTIKQQRDELLEKGRSVVENYVNDADECIKRNPDEGFPQCRSIVSMRDAIAKIEGGKV